MGLHRLGQVMGQVLGFSHCKESASTVSTTPDSTPSSTEGVSEESDFLEPQTAQEHSDDDERTDSSLYWGTPRQMSLESTLSGGTPLVQAPCFPAVFPSGSPPKPAVSGSGEGSDGPGGKRPSESAAAHRTRERSSAPRGLVRTETIETFLAEEDDEPEDYYLNLSEATDRHRDSAGRETAPEPEHGPAWDPAESASAGSALSHRDGEGPGSKRSPAETEPTSEGLSELQLRLAGESRVWGRHGVPEGPAPEQEAQAAEGRPNEDDAASSRVATVTRPSSEAGPGPLREWEAASSDPSLPPVTEAAGMAGKVEVPGSMGMAVPPAGVGTVDVVLPGRCSCCVYTSNDTGCQHSLALVTAPDAYQTQELTDDCTPAEDWQSPQQPSALDQSERPKTQGLEAADQSVIDLLYWEDVKKTGTLFGAIVLILFSLTQFSGISVLAYLTLSILSVTISLRFYTSVLHLIYKTQEVHPFQ
uniref:reticulon-2-like n=1 Tax=Pristiophorus japonicus TaxID=55135 RepID=UPI00398F1C42